MGTSISIYSTIIFHMQFLNDHEIFYNHLLNSILSLQLQLQHHQMHMLMLTMLINENLHSVPVVIIMKIIIINCVLVVVLLIYICIENIYNIRIMCVCVYFFCNVSRSWCKISKTTCTFHFTNTIYSTYKIIFRIIININSTTMLYS